MATSSKQLLDADERPNFSIKTEPESEPEPEQNQSSEDEEIPCNQQQQETIEPPLKRVRTSPSSRNQTKYDQMIQKSKNSIQKLKANIANNTCPKNLRYSARATINTDERFRKEVTEIKRKAEQQFLKSLVKCQERNIERLRIQKSKSTRFVNRLDKFKPSAPEHNVTKDVNSELQPLKSAVFQILSKLEGNITNIQSEQYQSLSYAKSKQSNPEINETPNKQNQKSNQKSKKRRLRRNKKLEKNRLKLREKNEQYIKNMSTKKLSNEEVNLLAIGLQFVRTPITNQIN